MLELLGALALTLASYFYPTHLDLFAPQQIHTAWTEHIGQISVMWVTEAPVNESMVIYRAAVCDGKEVAGQWRSAQAQQKLFDHYSLQRQQSIYTAIMAEQLAECMYEYQVGAELYWSPIFHISGRTPNSAEGSAEQPATIAVIGDMGIGNWSDYSRALLTDLAQQHDIDAVFHLGDFAYNLHSAKGKVGDKFLREIEPIATSVPYMVAPGNHEQKHNFTHYKARFRMPRGVASEDSNFYYSFNLGPAHIVVISTEVYSSKDKSQIRTQQNWLRSDLRDANRHRREVPWVIVMGHKPTYCNIDWTRPLTTSKAFRSNNNCYKQSPNLRKHIEGILYEEKVDLYIGAHVHKYERNAAIYRNETYPSEAESHNFLFNPTAPVHILTGIAGNDHGPNPLSPTPQSWSRVQSNEYGFGVLRVANTTHLLWEHFDARTRKKNDVLVVQKSRPTY